jgi:hypothetical protein
MFLRRTVRTVFAISCILLVLAASLPEVICCCDISWGPGGLLGNSRECLMDCCGEITSEGSCCDDSECEAKDEMVLADGSGSICNCSFSLVPPPPMTGSDAVSVDTGDAKLLGVPSTFFDSQAPATIPGAEPLHSLPAPFILTPGSRCALLQSWRA